MYALFLDSLIFIGYCVLSFPRAILSDIFKGISKDSIAMVTGNLLHQVLQNRDYLLSGRSLRRQFP